MLILLVSFILLLLFLGWIGGLPVSVKIPKESIALSAEVAKNLEGTLIPDFVLTYGIFLSPFHSCKSLTWPISSIGLPRQRRPILS
jgi:hypothetical protein